MKKILDSNMALLSPSHPVPNISVNYLQGVSEKDKVTFNLTVAPVADVDILSHSSQIHF